MAPCRIGAPVVRAQHFAERRIVVERDRRAVRADQRFPVPDEVDQRALLRLGERRIAVGHHHHAVELGEVFRRDERDVDLVGALERLGAPGIHRDVEAAGLAKLGHRLLRGIEALVIGDARIGQEEELLASRGLGRSGRLRGRCRGETPGHERDDRTDPHEISHGLPRIRPTSRA